MEDREIIALYFGRDQQAIARTAEKYGSFCQRMAENILARREDAEECVNDTYHAAWRTIPPQRPQSLRAFLGRIVRNLAISRWRRDRAKKRYEGVELLLSELEDCVPSPRQVEQELESRAVTAVIENWLEELPPGDRRIFLRRYWYGEPLQKLAGEQGCAPNALAQRMARLRKSLRLALEAEGEHL